MNLVFTNRFAKDLRTIEERPTKAAVEITLDRMRSARRVDEIGDVIKIKGSKNAFRVRVGEYRIGFFLDGDVVTLGRFADRKDIYRLFP